MQLVTGHNAEVRKRILDMNDAGIANYRHALVDVEWRLLGHAPDRLQGCGRAAGEAVHRLSDVGMLEAVDVNRLRIGVDDPIAGKPEHQVGVVDRVANDGADLVEDLRGPGGGNVSARAHRDDLANFALGDRLLGHAVARVEAADVADLQNPL